MLKHFLMKTTLLIGIFATLCGLPLVSQAKGDWIKVNNDMVKEARVNVVSEPKDQSDLDVFTIILQPGQSSGEYEYKFKDQQSLIIFYGGYPNDTQYIYNMREEDRNQEIQLSRLVQEGFEVKEYRCTLPTEQEIDEFLERAGVSRP